MNKTILALAFMVGASSTAIAGSAAPMVSKPSVARAATEVSLSSFAGFYVGIQGGQTGATGTFSLSPHKKSWQAHNFTQDTNGSQFGVMMGYNWDIGDPSGWIIGIEADYFGGSVSMNNAPERRHMLDGGTDSFSVSDQITIRLKGGFDMNGFMPFVAAGVSCANIQMASSHWMFKAHNSNGTECGSSLAAGAEISLGKGWSVRGEYRENDYGPVSTGQGLVGIQKYLRF